MNTDADNEKRRLACVRLPRHVHQDFKSLVMKQGKLIQDVMEELITTWMAAQKGSRPRKSQ